MTHATRADWPTLDGVRLGAGLYLSYAPLLDRSDCFVRLRWPGLVWYPIWAPPARWGLAVK